MFFLLCNIWKIYIFIHNYIYFSSLEIKMHEPKCVFWLSNWEEQKRFLFFVCLFVEETRTFSHKMRKKWTKVYSMIPANTCWGTTGRRKGKKDEGKKSKGKKQQTARTREEWVSVGWDRAVFGVGVGKTVGWLDQQPPFNTPPQTSLDPYTTNTRTRMHTHTHTQGGIPNKWHSDQPIEVNE